MNGKKSNPPGLALWLLRHGCPDEYREALAGDLVERFGEGQSRAWFWRQVLISLAIHLSRSTGGRWPLFAYAVAGTIAMGFFPHSQPLSRLPAALDWSHLSWPWSQLVFEFGPPAVVALGSLSVLVAGLVMVRSFRWAYLVRTGIFNLILIAMARYAGDAFPWLLRPVPGHPNFRVSIIPFPLEMLFAFLIAAWLGCPIGRPGGRPVRSMIS